MLSSNRWMDTQTTAFSLFILGKFAEKMNVVKIVIRVLRKRNGKVDQLCKAVQMRESVKQRRYRVPRFQHDVAERHAFPFRIDDAADDVADDRGGHIAQRMSVRDRRDLRRLFVELRDAERSSGLPVQRRRRDAHHTAAALAVVSGGFYIVGVFLFVYYTFCICGTGYTDGGQGHGHHL